MKAIYSELFSANVGYLIVFIIFIYFAFRKSKLPFDNNAKNIPIFENFLQWVVKKSVLLETFQLLLQYRKEGLKTMEKLVQERGPIFEFPCFIRKLTVISDPVLIQKILCSNDDRILNKPRFLYDKVLTECFRRGLISSEVSIWRPHREAILNCFTYKNYINYLSYNNKHGRNLISNWISNTKNFKSESNGSRFVEIQNKELYVSVRLTFFKIISEIVLGEDIFSNEELHNFHEHFKIAKDVTFYRAYTPQNLIPIFWWFNPKKKEFDFSLGQFRDHVMIGVKRCKQKLISQAASPKKNPLNGGENSQTILEKMIDCGASDKEMFDEIGTLLFAGHDTTNMSVHVFLQLIAEYPQHQLKCQEEIDKIFEINDVNSHCTELTMDHLSNLQYLEKCILEALRMVAVGPIFSRELSAPMEINGQCFKKGTIFTFPVYAIQKDPKVYPEPDKFNPNRFSPENAKQRHPYTFFPFSNGPRGCIGTKLSMMQMKVILAYILHHFDVHTTDRFVDLKFFHSGVATPERNFNISLKSRRTL